MGAYSILRDYFGVDGEPPVYGGDAFEERFRMPRPVFNRLFRAIYNEPYWRRTVNATGHPQSHAIQKVAAALRVLSDGEPFDRSDEYCRLSRSTIEKAAQRLTVFINNKREPTYLKPPTDEELEHILTGNAARGMPGCIGFIDCTHWQWAKCPKALGGQYLDRKGKRSIVIETVCDEDLYIWNLFVGCPGASKDKNVLACSPLMLGVNAGVWPPRSYSYTLNGRSRRFLHYAADAGYPRYALFALPHPKPDTPRLVVYNRLQEAVRKNAEHVGHVDRVLRLLRGAGMTLRLLKCRFFQKTVEYLGHEIKPGRLGVMDAHTRALRKAHFPTTRKQVRSSVGMSDVFR